MAKETTKSGRFQAKSAKSAYAGKSVAWKKGVSGIIPVGNDKILVTGTFVKMDVLEAGTEVAVRLNSLPFPERKGYSKGMAVTVAEAAAKVKAKIPVVLNTQHSTCFIIEVADSAVIAEVLIDKKNNLTQTRRFDKLPLEGVIDCKEGALFNLTIVTKPGSREFIYTPGNPDDIKYFEETLVDTTSLRDDLKNDPVYNQGPILNDDGDTF